MELAWIAVLVSVGIVLALLAVWYARRELRSRRVQALGWTFAESPGQAPAYRLNQPPFGVGEVRKLRDLITGQGTDGLPFKAFRYLTECSEDRVLVLPLTRSVPKARLRRSADHSLSWQGDNVEFINAIRSAVEAAVGRYPEPVLDLSLDGAAMVLVGVPSDLNALRSTVVHASEIRRALLPAIPDHTPQPRVPEELSVQDRPEWTYRERDDSWLHLVRHQGSNGQAKRVLSGHHYGMEWVALTHHWTTTSGFGNEARTERHQEDLFQIRVPRGFGNLAVNRAGQAGEPVTFDDAAFDQEFQVRGDDPGFCRQVFHPQMRAFLMARGAPAFAIEDRVYRVVFTYSHQMIDFHLEFLRQFLSWTPASVWESIGHSEPPDFGSRPELLH